MLIPNHPHDERLSALASGDPEAVADSALSEHVASCIRCTDTVAELGALRAALAEMPDLQPHRPLQLLPPVPTRRRVPIASVAGHAASSLRCSPPGPRWRSSDSSGPRARSSVDWPSRARQTRVGRSCATGRGQPADASEGYTFDGTSAGGAESAGEEPAELQPLQSEDAAEPDADSGGDTERLVLTDDRPVWPMLLFAGVAIMIAAALLRWILAPRAG